MAKTDRIVTYSQIKLPEELVKKIDLFCEITETSKEDAVIKALDEYISPYIPTDDKEPIRAMYKREPDDEAVSCFIIDDQSDLKFMPGYRIVVNGRLLRVSADSVTKV